MKRLLLIFCCAIVGITSCKKENTAPSDNVTGHEYFPVYEGFERFYHVDSIAWDNFTATVDTFSYDVKEVIGETYTDNEGRPTQKIYRYLHDNSGNWVIWKVWSMNNLATRAEQTEDNLRYVKLIFSPALNEKWNGNAYNTSDPLEYKITDMSASETVGSLTFNSVLTVTQQDEDNLSERHLDEERYAANIGLYYRKNIHQKKVFPTDDIESGYIYTEILTGYSPIPLQYASPQNPD